MTACQVTFRDKWREVSVDLPGPPLLVPRELRLVARAEDAILLGPPVQADDDGVADVIAGSVPLVYLNGVDVAMAWMDIPPPAPLTLLDLNAMWRQLIDSGLPIPPSIQGQGRSPSGRLSPSTSLLAEYLEVAHTLARTVLTRWPQSKSTTLRWQHLELPGGREDAVRTMRFAGRYPQLCTAQGAVPAMSVRRIGATPPWKSRALALAARRACAVVADASWLGDVHARRVLMQPFLVIAKTADGEANRPDPPLSTWPTDCRKLYEVLVALGALASASPESPQRAPLCLVWRLYEAWIASEVFVALEDDADATRVEFVTDQAGYEWLGRWHVPSGELIACAQLRIGEDPKDLDGRLPRGIRSITSTLIPDVSIFFVGDGGLAYRVIDAKRRSAIAMRADDAAEAASKYLWGIRLDGPETAAVLDSAVIATTAKAPTMFSAASRIQTMQIVPGGLSLADVVKSQYTQAPATS